MQVSVVLCTYSSALYDDFCDAADSVLGQTHDDVELVVVVDGNQELVARIEQEYGHREEVVIHCNDENVGLSASRNNGFEHASGDIVAFLDDDAVAREDWVAELVGTYDRHDALAAGGRMAPRWVAGKPVFLPAEFYWLVGVTHRGHPDEECEVRNTFGSNISFRSRVLEELDGFEPDLGRYNDRQVQGEETELAARMLAEYGEGVWYNPEAVVEHKIFDYRTDPGWLTKRAFWQGYSKRVMAEFLPTDGGEGGEESAFLKRLFTTFVPDRLRGLATDPSLTTLLQLLMIFVLTGAVGAGYVYALVAHWHSWSGLRTKG